MELQERHQRKLMFLISFNFCKQQQYSTGSSLRSRQRTRKRNSDNTKFYSMTISHQVWTCPTLQWLRNIIKPFCNRQITCRIKRWQQLSRVIRRARARTSPRCPPSCSSNRVPNILEASTRSRPRRSHSKEAIRTRTHQGRWKAGTKTCPKRCNTSAKSAKTATTQTMRDYKTTFSFLKVSNSRHNRFPDSLNRGQCLSNSPSRCHRPQWTFLWLRVIHRLWEMAARL